MNTSWLAFLETQSARFDQYQASFAPPQEETRNAATGTVLVPLTHLGLISIGGEEAAEFLHKLGSNDVKTLAADRAQYNSLNSAKGRMLASFLVWRSGDDFRLALAADLQSTIARKLSMYVLRSKVKVTEVSDRVLLGLAGPQAATLLASIGLNAPAGTLSVSQGESLVTHLDGERYILETDAIKAESLWTALCANGAQPAGSSAWNWLDIQAGIPLVSLRTQDEFVAQMLNFELLGGVSFTKGCYPGQEIVARTQYLGKLKKRMFRGHTADESAVELGTNVYAPEFGEQSCGKVVAIEAAPQGGRDLLAVMQISAFEAGEVHLGTPAGPRLELASLPYSID